MVDAEKENSQPQLAPSAAKRAAAVRTRRASTRTLSESSASAAPAAKPSTLASPEESPPAPHDAAPAATQDPPPATQDAAPHDAAVPPPEPVFLTAPPESSTVSSAGPGPAREPVRVTRSTGVFKDYLCGLDHMRQVVQELESDLDSLLAEFYACPGGRLTEEAAGAHLRAVSAALAQCNAVLERAGQRPLVVDSQAQLAAVLTGVRRAAGADLPADAVSAVAAFWEASQLAGERFQALVGRFQASVLQRLRAGCGSYKAAAAASDLPAPENYSREVAAYLTTLEDASSGVRLLVASFGHRMDLSLVGRASLRDRLLRGCDDEAFPVLQLVPALTAKAETLFRVTRQWLDRDETYVFEIGEAIRATRSETRRKEEEMRAEREKQRDLIKSVKSAFLICQNSKRKIREVAEELARLEGLLNECSSEQRQVIDEKEKKESMAEFLEISITQTRRNYNLQLRRQKLMRQVNELEGNLNEIQEQMAELKSEMSSKSSSKQMAEEKHSLDSQSFSYLKMDLDTFTKNVVQINADISNLRSSISELERIQIFKTSPERVDDFFDRPRSVKLAPSLQQKLSLRKNVKS